MASLNTRLKCFKIANDILCSRNVAYGMDEVAELAFEVFTAAMPKPKKVIDFSMGREAVDVELDLRKREVNLNAGKLWSELPKATRWESLETPQTWSPEQVFNHIVNNEPLSRNSYPTKL